MKSSRPILTVCEATIFAVAVIMAGLPGPAYCQVQGPALLLQQEPAEGGTITPAAGIHRFALNTTVTLTAVAKPGYQFVYWLGDVGDAVANRTTVYVDGPKIVIAVFERAEFELLEFNEMPTSAPGGGAIASAGAFGPRGFGGGGGRRPPKFRRPPPFEPPEQPDFPVPGDSDDFPVPVPEPGTAGLLALGSLCAVVRRRTRKEPQRQR
jgi:hypothetical protein